MPTTGFDPEMQCSWDQNCVKLLCCTFPPLKRAYLCSMSFYLIGTAFPGFLSPLVLYAFDLFVLFLHLTFEQNSVICPPQGSLQRFFRGGGLSPPAIDSLLATILCIQCSIQGWAEKMGPRLREFFRQGEAKVVSNSRNKLQQT